MSFHGIAVFLQQPGIRGLREAICPEPIFRCRSLPTAMSQVPASPRSSRSAWEVRRFTTGTGTCQRPSGQQAGGLRHDGRHGGNDHGPQHVRPNSRRVGRLGLAGLVGRHPALPLPGVRPDPLPTRSDRNAGRDRPFTSSPMGSSPPMRRPRPRLVGAPSRSREEPRAHGRRSQQGWSMRSISKSPRCYSVPVSVCSTGSRRVGPRSNWFGCAKPRASPTCATACCDSSSFSVVGSDAE